MPIRCLGDPVFADFNTWLTPLYRAVKSIGVIAATIVLVACGDSKEDSDVDIEAAVANTQNQVTSVLNASGIIEQTANGSNAVRMQLDGGEGVMGSDLPVPEWMPAGFPFPDDLSIFATVIEQDGTRVLSGNSATVTKDTYWSRVISWGKSHDMEILNGGGLMLTLVTSSGDIIDVETGDNIGVEVKMSKRSVATDRQRSAAEINSRGIAHIKIDGETWNLEGDCTIKGTQYGFQHSSSDGSTTAEFSIQSADSTPYGSASLFIVGSDGARAFNTNFPLDSDLNPDVHAEGTRFSISGKFSRMTMGADPADGTFAVECEQ